MKIEDFLKIIEIIDEDYRNSDVEDLKKIRSILNEKIEILDPSDNISEVDDATFEANIDILLQNFFEFCEENITEVSEKKGLKSNKLYKAFQYVLNEFEDEEYMLRKEVDVYKTLGLDKNQLMKYRYVGEKVLDTYEKHLNKYGLSMDQKLTESQLARLEEIKKERDASKKL